MCTFDLRGGGWGRGGGVLTRSCPDRKPLTEASSGLDREGRHLPLFSSVFVCIVRFSTFVCVCVVCV